MAKKVFQVQVSSVVLRQFANYCIEICRKTESNIPKRKFNAHELMQRSKDLSCCLKRLI